MTHIDPYLDSNDYQHRHKPDCHPSSNVSPNHKQDKSSHPHSSHIPQYKHHINRHSSRTRSGTGIPYCRHRPNVGRCRIRCTRGRTGSGCSRLSRLSRFGRSGSSVSGSGIFGCLGLVTSVGLRCRLCRLRQNCITRNLQYCRAGIDLRRLRRTQACTHRDHS